VAREKVSETLKQPNNTVTFTTKSPLPIHFSKLVLGVAMIKKKKLKPKNKIQSLPSVARK
jgi:hypothetical protein